MVTKIYKHYTNKNLIIIIIYEIERRKKNQKESYYVLIEERHQIKRRRECNNSQISMKQLDWKFGTNSSFNSSFSFPWKGSAPALLVGSSTPVIELQFLKR